MSRCVTMVISSTENKLRERNAKWLRSSAGQQWLTGFREDSQTPSADRATLLQQLDRARFNAITDLLRRRGLTGPLCERCEGLGVILYDNDTTWGRSAVATHGPVFDVCDQCWGSGDDSRPWLDLRSVIGFQRDLSLSQNMRKSDRRQLHDAQQTVVLLWDALQHGATIHDPKLEQRIECYRKRLTMTRNAMHEHRDVYSAEPDGSLRLRAERDGIPTSKADRKPS